MMKAVWLFIFINMYDLQGEYLLVKLDEKGNKNLDCFVDSEILNYLNIVFRAYNDGQIE
jgi:hypothetical protein